MFSDSLTYELDSLSINISTNKIQDSLKSNIRPTPNNQHYNPSEVKRLKDYANVIEVEKDLFDLSERNLPINPKENDYRLVRFKYEGALKNEVNTYPWLTICLDKDRKIILISISEMRSGDERLYENFFYENGEIVLINKVFEEFERTGWEDVSSNVYSNSYVFSKGGLMAYYKNDTEGFSMNYSQLEGTYNLNEIGAKEYFTATYFFEIGKYLVQVAEHKTQTANKT